MFDKIRIKLDNTSYKGYPFELQFVEEYNLTLGDVYAMMESYKGLSGLKEIDYYFIYIMKVLYSIQLSQDLYKGFISFNNEDNRESAIEEDTNIFRPYLELINTSFMPENVNYFEYVYDIKEEDYKMNLSLVSNIEDRRNIGEDNIDNDGDKDTNTYGANRDSNLTIRNNSPQITTDIIVDLFINSTVTSRGDIRKVIQSRKSNLGYYQLYSFEDTYGELRDKSLYRIKFYVFCTKRKYVENVIKNGLSSNYLFFNLFHTDSFIRYTYSDNSGKNKYTKVLKEINRILTNNKYTWETKLSLNFSNLDSIFINSSYSIPYENEGELGDILISMASDGKEDEIKLKKEKLAKTPNTFSALRKEINRRGYNVTKHELENKTSLASLLGKYGLFKLR